MIHTSMLKLHLGKYTISRIQLNQKLNQSILNSMFQIDHQ